MTVMQRAILLAGGLIKTAELHALGYDRAGIAAAVHRGEIVRIRQGWYASPSLPWQQAQAARIGGQLACSSAAGALGMWEPEHTAIHVCVPPDSRDLRSPTASRTRLRDSGRPSVVHWSGLDPEGTRTLVSPGRCLAQVASCEAADVARAVIESGLRRGVVTLEQWRSVLASLPAPRRAELSAASGISESGTESIFVHRLARLGIAVRQQVVIQGVGRVDALIGTRLVIELDSIEFHSDPTADRARDAALSARGYRVLRFMYSQVIDDWPRVEAAICAAIARGDHLG